MANREVAAEAGEFDRATAVRPDGPGRFLCDIPDRWTVIGGPINGGFVQALAVRAMREVAGRAVPDAVTSTGHFISATVPGPATIEVDVDRARAGRRHTTVSASVLQGPQERVRVLATFADLGTASGPQRLTARPPTLPPPEACEQLPAEVLPPFLERFDLRFAPGTGGALAGDHSGEAEISAWLRFADGREPDTLSLVMVADALPPAILNALDAAWVPTLEMTVHVRNRPAPGWLRARFTTRALIAGYLEEDGEVWDSEDRLVALSRQLARTRTRPAVSTS